MISLIIDSEYKLKDIQPPVDVNSITGLLKLFFRQLADSLIPRSQHERYLKAIDISDEQERLVVIHELINELHDANYATLKSLILHLAKICSFSEFNKMGAVNLAIVWGPTIINMQIPFGNQSKVIEYVITNCYQFFDADN